MQNEPKSNVSMPLILSVIAVTIAITVLIFVGKGGVPPVPGPGQANKGIFVNGSGTVDVAPDQARVILGVETDAKSAGEAQAKNAASMNLIVTQLKKLNISDKDMQTTELSLYPVRQFIKELGQEQVTGYHLSNKLIITVRSLNNLGAVIDTSITAGANNVNNVSFIVASTDKWREKAITEAIRDARAKAETMAKASGVKIKRVSYINDATVDVRPYNIEMQSMDLRAAAKTLIEPGDVKIQANVQMGFDF